MHLASVRPARPSALRGLPSRARALALGLLLLLAAAPVDAQEKETFTDERFAALQAEGAVILVDIFADWCSTCAEQQRVLEAFQEAHPDAPVHILEIDFDDRKDLVRRFAAPRQSTFVLYRGEERLWYAVAETRREVIFSQLLAAVQGG